MDLETAGNEALNLALARLLKYDSLKSPVPVTVCLASSNKPGDDPTFAVLSLSNGVTQRFRDIADDCSYYLRRKRERGDVVLRPYEPGTKPDGFEIEYLKLDDCPSVERQLEPLSNMGRLPGFDANEDFVAGLKFYAIVVQPPQEGPIVFIRSYGPKKQLQRSKWMGLQLTGEHFDQIVEPTFLFDDDVDCVAIDGYLFVKNKTAFQDAFQFYELVVKRAAQTLAKVQANVPMKNFELLQDACLGQRFMLSKINSIASRNVWHTVGMSSIKAAISRHNLQIEIVTENGCELLVYDPKYKWEIMRLLDDDYLNSQMTGQDYEVTSKRIHK